jgi:hypothetical protein
VSHAERLKKKKGKMYSIYTQSYLSKKNENAQV